MENEVLIRKDMKVEIPELTPPTPGMLSRKGSLTKSTCLCSPTTHAGSFRCRLHRSPTLRRTKSIDSPACQDSKTKANTAVYVSMQNNAVDAQ
ncbi:hypothetical protein C2S51_033361 [Perilla frutescens var. frutescens]|nr:hypothetical protein C2S51_033361 [Perilla frutescens var. frutescens]